MSAISNIESIQALARLNEEGLGAIYNLAHNMKKEDFVRDVGNLLANVTGPANVVEKPAVKPRAPRSTGSSKVPGVVGGAKSLTSVRGGWADDTGVASNSGDTNVTNRVGTASQSTAKPTGAPTGATGGENWTW